MFSCVFSCEEETALSIIDPTSALIELNNARRQKGRKTAGLLDIAEEQLPSLEVSRMEVLILLGSLVLMFVRIRFEMFSASRPKRARVAESYHCKWNREISLFFFLCKIMISFLISFQYAKRKRWSLTLSVVGQGNIDISQR